MEAGFFILKALSNLSLTFLSINLVFGLIGLVPPWHLLLFLGSNLISLSIYYIKQGKPGNSALVLSFVAIVLASLPLFFLSLTGIVYVLINYAPVIYIGWSGIELKRDYWLMTDIFTKGLIFIVLMVVILLVIGHSILSVNNFLYYILIFLVSSVNLLRTLRHLLYNNDQQEIVKINLRYSLAIISIASILGIPAARGLLWNSLGKTYDLLVWILSELLSWLSVPITYILNLLVRALRSLGWKGQPQHNAISGAPLSNPIQSSGALGSDFFEKLHRFLQVSVKILIIVALLYGLFKLLRRFNDSGQEAEEYRESRELLFSLGERRPNLPNISDIFTRRNGAEAVRHYYRKFLHICQERGIKILPSDTTSEINRKGEEHFDKDVLKAMRRIYIQVRYGKEACRKEKVEYFRDLFKRLDQGPGG